jgi:parvulin-like peptidyl-prolyl isomerase
VTRRVLLPALVLLAFVGTACGRYLTTGVAVVNGVSISQKDLDAQFDVVRQSQQFQGQFDPNNPEQRLEVERQIIVGLIQQELVRQEGERMGIRVTPAMIQQQFAQVRAQFQTEQQFQDALKANQLTVATLREQLESQVLLQAVQARVTRNVVASEQDIRQAFGRGEAFEEIKVRHILFSAQGTNLGPARNEAQAALAQLRAGADFAAIAKKQSDDPGSKDKGGDLGYITRQTSFDQQFLAAAFALKKGQLSGIVQTSFGFHIIRVDDVRRKTLDQVRAQLGEQLAQQRKQQAFQGFVAARIKVYDIVVNPRWGDFNAETLAIDARRFFVPPSPEPQTRPFTIG